MAIVKTETPTEQSNSIPVFSNSGPDYNLASVVKPEVPNAAPMQLASTNSSSTSSSRPDNTDPKLSTKTETPSKSKQATKKKSAKKSSGGGSTKKGKKEVTLAVEDTTIADPSACLCESTHCFTYLSPKILVSLIFPLSHIFGFECSNTRLFENQTYKLPLKRALDRRSKWSVSLFLSFEFRILRKPTVSCFLVRHEAWIWEASRGGGW